jgi:hypothetical protein
LSHHSFSLEALGEIIRPPSVPALRAKSPPKDLLRYLGY